MPLRFRHGYAAGLHRGLRSRRPKPTPKFPTPRCKWCWCASQTSPNPPGLELAGDLRGVKALVPRVHLLLMLAGPRPSGSAGLSRRCRGCLLPSPASPGSSCPQLRYAAATAQRRRSFTSARLHSASWRTKSPSQCPGTALSAASAGRCERTTSAVTCPCGLFCDRARGSRSARPVRRHVTSSRLRAPRPSMNSDW